MPSSATSNAAKSLRDAVCTALESALAEASRSKWTIVQEDEPSVRPETASSGCYSFQFDDAISGAALLMFPASTIENLDLKETEAAVASSEAVRSPALLKALVGGISHLEEALAEFGKVTVAIEDVDSAPPRDEQVIKMWVQRSAGESEGRYECYFCISAELLTSLSVRSAKPLAYGDAAGVAATANLDLVMDVELDVTLRFGQRQLALRDVLELTSGSVVELDRLVDEPVELILDGKVVARGEAVIIDGNYGMRITEVVQQMVP